MAKTDWTMYDIVKPDDMNQIGEEINAAATAASEANEQLDELSGSLTSHIDDTTTHTVWLGNTAGTENAYTAVANPKLTTLAEGNRISFKAHVASGNNPTLKIGNLTAYPLKKANGNQAKLSANGVYTAVYSAEAFILQGEGGEVGTAGVAQVLEGYTVGTEDGLENGAIPVKAGAQTAKNAYMSSSTPGRIRFKIDRGFYPDEKSADEIRWDTNGAMVAENLKKGVKVFGMTGEYEGEFGTATPADVLESATIHTPAGTVPGTIPVREPSFVSTDAQADEGHITVPAPGGYYPETLYIDVAEPNLKPANVKAGVSMFNGTLVGEYQGGEATLSDTTYDINMGTIPDTGEKIVISIEKQKAIAFNPALFDKAKQIIVMSEFQVPIQELTNYTTPFYSMRTTQIFTMNGAGVITKTDTYTYSPAEGTYVATPAATFTFDNFIDLKYTFRDLSNYESLIGLNNSMPGKVRIIMVANVVTSNSGNALPEHVLAGKTFMNASGQQTGTMPNNGLKELVLGKDKTYVDLHGFYSSMSRVYLADGFGYRPGDYVFSSAFGIPGNWKTLLYYRGQYYAFNHKAPVASTDYLTLCRVSSDARTWTNLSLGEEWQNISVEGAKVVGNILFIWGKNYTTSTPFAGYTTNGTTFLRITSPVNASLADFVDVMLFNGTWMIMQRDGYYIYRSNESPLLQTNWTTGTLGGARKPSYATDGNLALCIHATADQIYYNTGSGGWKTVFLSSAPQYKYTAAGVDAKDGYIFAMVKDGRMALSKDPTIPNNWQEVDLPASFQPLGLAFLDGRYITWGINGSITEVWAVVRPTTPRQRLVFLPQSDGTIGSACFSADGITYLTYGLTGAEVRTLRSHWTDLSLVRDRN